MPTSLADERSGHAARTSGTARPQIGPKTLAEEALTAVAFISVVVGSSVSESRATVDAMNKALLAIACPAVSLLALPRAVASTITEPGVIILVADPGNQADTTGFGAVGYAFAISKYEVSISQYTEFLNSVATITASGSLMAPELHDVNASAARPALSARDEADGVQIGVAQDKPQPDRAAGQFAHV